MLKQYLAEINKTFMAIINLYERERKFLNKETEGMIKTSRLRGLQRRTQKIKKELRKLKEERLSTGGEIIMNES